MSELVNVQVDAHTETWLTSRRDPSDEWSRDSTAGRVTNVTALVTDKAPMDWGYGGKLVKSLPVKAGDTVYAVVVDYESGDTFGRSGGHAQVMDVFTDQADALALVKICRAYEEADSRSAKVRPLLEYKGREYMADWSGYFESVNSIDLWGMTVGGNSATDSEVTMKWGN